MYLTTTEYVHLPEYTSLVPFFDKKNKLLKINKRSCGTIASRTNTERHEHLQATIMTINI